MRKAKTLQLLQTLELALFRESHEILFVRVSFTKNLKN